jgi:Uma2 family endonuclease
MGLLEGIFRSQPDVLVVHDMKHLFGRGFPSPAPDISVIRGVRDRDADRQRFNAKQEGVLPCLIVEVVYPRNADVRRADLVDKVKTYEQIGIAEYVIVDSPRRKGGRSYTLLGYRRDREGRYRPIEPDVEGRLCSQTTGIAFQVSPDGRRVLLFEVASGRRLLSPAEWEAVATREAEARASAEAEAARLREELERLRSR